MLSSHGRKIFIHTLVTTRSILEDPSLTSEGAGGKVSNYRIDVINDIMKSCRFAPFSSVKKEPLSKAYNKIERYTSCWPITSSKVTWLLSKTSWVFPQMPFLKKILVKKKWTIKSLMRKMPLCYNF